MTVRIPRSATSAAVDAFALRPPANLLSQLQLSCQGRQAVGVHPASTAIRTRSAGQHRRDCAGSASGSARRTARQQNRYTHWLQQLLAPPLGFPLQTCRRGYATAGSSSSLPPQGTAAAAAAAAAAGSADGGPAALYERKVQQGLLRRDEHQLPIVAELQELYEAILQYRPPPVPEPMHEADGGDPMRAGFLSRLFGRSSRDSAATVPQIPEDVPKSVYLFGDVGCGKSMLMDLLYESLPASVAKRRVHFHAFMIDVHKRLHKLASDTNVGGKGDAIVPVARELARDGRVLCFDEFQVTDIADAMILRRLMESLIGYGFVIVITSNRTPDDLYKNGIQRSSFLPCISLIHSHFKIRDLDSPTDYRKIPRALAKVYYDPISPENRLEFYKIVEGFALAEKSTLRLDRELDVWGRKLAVPRSSQDGKVAIFTFRELCGNPLSAADYLEIVKQFEVVFIEDIPQLTLSQKDQARRFILFIDAAYESKTKLLTLSSVPITQIFSDQPASAGSSADDGYSAHQRSMMDDLGLNAETVGASSIFTGDEEVFAFARAVSRLTEMGSREWAERARST